MINMRSLPVAVDPVPDQVAQNHPVDLTFIEFIRCHYMAPILKATYSLGFNADLIAQFDDPYVIADSFWLDAESLRMRLSWTKGPWINITKFLYGNLPDHCKGDQWGLSLIHI